MRFWKRSTRREESTRAADTGQVEPARPRSRRSPPVAMEVKLLAIEALEDGAERRDVARIVGVHQSTLASWHKQYTEGGVSGMCRKSSSIAVRRQCTKLEEKILAHRRDHPDHGVRRIRDELRREQNDDEFAQHGQHVDGVLASPARSTRQSRNDDAGKGHGQKEVTRQSTS